MGGVTAGNAIPAAAIESLLPRCQIGGCLELKKGLSLPVNTSAAETEKKEGKSNKSKQK